MAQRLLKLFATPVIVDDLDDTDGLNRELEAAILERMSKHPGLKRSNVGGWHSTNDFLRWTGEGGKRVALHAIQLANANTENLAGAAPRVGWRVEGWANVSSPGNTNSNHIHGGAYWSVVYYVRAGEGQGGNLLLNDPRMPALRMHAPGLRFKDMGPDLVASVTPKPGRMILFPSWLSHSVAPFEGAEQRISIAMNLVATRGGSNPVRAVPAPQREPSKDIG
jgi:uncharacterized protein (TIGR02466 family)